MPQTPPASSLSLNKLCIELVAHLDRAQWIVLGVVRREMISMSSIEELEFCVTASHTLLIELKRRAVEFSHNQVMQQPKDNTNENATAQSQSKTVEVVGDSRSNIPN
jgi:hypothetical protein